MLYMSIYQYNGITGWWFQICVFFFIPVQPRGSVLVMPLGAAGPWVVMQHVHAKRCLAYPTEKAARQTSTELFAMASKIFKSPEC